MKIKLSAILLFIILFSQAKAQSGLELANKMITKVNSLKTLQCTFEAQERIMGKVFTQKNDFKINIAPFKTYFKQDYPEKGLEGLYITGENENKVKINPNAFPWVTLNLDPEGDLMMKNHHHPIFHAGFAYVAEVLEMLIGKYQSRTAQLIVNKGTLVYQGQDVIVLDCTNPFYKIQSLTINKSETPYSIGKRLHINYYSILEENTGLKPFSEIEAGKTIKIPTDYASKMVIYLHKTQLYPVYIKISDPKGMFEEYKFTNVILNPVYKADDFQASNKKYNF